MTNEKTCECLWDEGECCGRCEDALTDSMFMGTEVAKHEHSCLIYLCTCSGRRGE